MAKTLSIIAFILAFILPLVGLILGIVALVKINRGQAEGKGFAVAAIVLGAIFTLVLPVLVFIGGLAYFGVLNPSTMLPDKCTFPILMVCVDYKVTSNSIMLQLQNGAGRDMIVNSLVATSEAVQGSCSSSGTVTLLNGASKSFSLTGCNFKDTGRDKNRYEITVNYVFVDSPSIPHTLTGELLARKPE